MTAVHEQCPAWFAAALADQPAHIRIEVSGAQIHVRTWGRHGDPALVLVHGGSAHSAWWDHVGPLLARGRFVAALDLSGHGDSARRETYDMLHWVAEVAEVAWWAGGSRGADVVAHSMGGRIAAAVASRSPDVVRGLVILDSSLVDFEIDEDVIASRRKPNRVYPTLEEAMSRFVTLPAQEMLLPYVREHVARASLREVSGGWTWKFDPRLRGTGWKLSDYVSPISAPVTFFRSEYGLLSEDMLPRLRAMLGAHAVMVELPAAGHHPMLDRPLELVAAVRTQLTAWQAV